MTKKSVVAQTLPLKIVGSNKFGRYNKISSEATFNMFISDGWMVPFPGHKKIYEVIEGGEGRGIFTSTRLGAIIFVIDQVVYTMNENLSINQLGELQTYSGPIYIEENNAKQIALCDQEHIYLYDYLNSTFGQIDTDFIPNYIDFQDGRFLAAVKGEPLYRLSDINDGTKWPTDQEGDFQTKADNVKAVISLPGKAGQILVVGGIVTEPWKDIGYQLFPYQRSGSYNIDYGVANEATIAKSDQFVVWLGVNEKSGLALFVTDGGSSKQISTDGINAKFGQVVHPEESYGSLFKKDGHLIYLLTFSHADDNFTLIYDFNNDSFYYITDEYMGHHIARKISFFNNTYYFISENDGNLYELNTKYGSFDGKEIPRVRVCETYRRPDSDPFIVDNLSFVTEQGQFDYTDNARIDMSVSRDGGYSFSNYVQMEMKKIGDRANMYDEYNLGYMNEFTPQFRFYGKERFVSKNGVFNVHQ